ncbi:MAG: class I SAM-dependent methyltransferase [Deltaproteobacteria bacterium]|nr:class I SAM-dependent methyltransferase [Deltaproteobacteria bacterium]
MEDSINQCAASASAASVVEAGGGRMVSVPCPLCGALRERLITIQNSYRVVSCAACSFVYVNPRPDDAALARLYLQYLPDKMADPLLWDSYMAGVFSKAADVIVKYKRAGRLLDIGCGYGFFLSEMKRRGGWELFGMDVSRTALSYASSQGHNAAQGTLDTVRHPENSFDVVTMFYVLEHVTGPVAALRAVKRILKPGGMLLLRVPHTTPIVKLLKLLGVANNLYDPPFHLSDFSASTIRRGLEEAGFIGIHTSIGGFTTPPETGKRLFTAAFGLMAGAGYSLSLGRFAMPGVAKNTIAFKP